MGHFDIPKLYALFHYVLWIRKMGILVNVNTALTEALHKTVKAAFRHSNKVDFIPQMCFWDDWRLSVEMRKATLQFLALDDVGHCSCTIQGHFEVPREVRPA
jgi:sugar/nucleoside kinase (ribokinase family)